jgi:Zn-dependent membrane protease YugP
MEGRSYKTAFTVAKIGEVLSWAIIIIGILIGFALMRDYGVKVGIAVMIIIAIPGFYLVYLSQLTLIFIDTENNTRQAMSEIQKTNMMLADTLGSMANNLKELANKEK